MKSPILITVNIIILLNGYKKWVLDNLNLVTKYII